MSLSDPWFDHVENGRKIFEGRRFFKDILHMQPKDLILFRHSTDKDRPAVIKKILHIHKFTMFEAALDHFDRVGRLQEILPGIKTVQEGVKIYFKYVSLDTQIKDGVCLIELVHV